MEAKVPTLREALAEVGVPDPGTGKRNKKGRKS